MNENEEILEFHDNPQNWRIGGLVLVAIAMAIVIVFWIFAERVMAESFTLTMIRIVVTLFALIIGVFGFSLARLPVRDLSFDSVYRVLNLREKFIFRTKTSDIRFSEVKDIFVEANELENSTNLRCYIELRDGERVEVPTGDADPDAVCSQLAKFIGLEK